MIDFHEDIDKTLSIKCNSLERLEDCNDLLPTDVSFMIFSLNIRSIQRNFDEFLITLNRMNISPDVIVLFPSVADWCRAIQMGKPRGIRTARKNVNHRREQRWADKDYKKAHMGTRWKANPFGGASHAKGIVLEKVGVEAKQPNSAIRKCVRVQLIKNGKKVTAFVTRDGCLNHIEENDEVLVAGFGRKGHAVGDIPEVRFKVVKVANVSLLALYKEKKERPRS